MKRLVLSCFALVSAIHLIAVYYGFATVAAISKPAIIILLGLHYLISTGDNRSSAMLVALIASLAGDILLLNPDHFIWGLATFMVAHVAYIVAYGQHMQEEDTDQLHGIHKVRIAFPIVLAATGLVVILYPGLGAMRLPVVIYALVIMVMVIRALFRWGRTGTASFVMVSAGAVLFMLSDSLIAINKFLRPLEHAHFWIMLTYIAAQLLIVDGIRRHSKV